MKVNNIEHLVIVRTSGSILNIGKYNCQELGLAKALYERGLRVSLILAGAEEKRMTIDNIDVFYCKYNAINQQLAWFWGLNRLLEELNPSLVQVHDMGLLMTWYVVRWAKNKKIRSFLIQGNYELTGKPIYRQLESLYNIIFGRYIIKKASGIGYKTPMAARFLESYYKREMIHTYVGLDDSKFKNYIRIDWKDRLGLKNKKILLYVGVLESRRNPLFLVRLIEQMPNDYVLLVVGTGPLESDVVKYIKGKNIKDKCILLGKLDQQELPSLYLISDLFLLPSSYEIYGMVIMEAMYFGLPVVSTLTAGSEFLIDNAKTGYIIQSLEIKKWKRLITSLINNKEALEKMKERAKVVADSKFLWDKAVDSFMHLYYNE